MRSRPIVKALFCSVTATPKIEPKLIEVKVKY